MGYGRRSAVRDRGFRRRFRSRARRTYASRRLNLRENRRRDGSETRVLEERSVQREPHAEEPGGAHEVVVRQPHAFLHRGHHPRGPARGRDLLRGVHAAHRERRRLRLKRPAPLLYGLADRRRRTRSCRTSGRPSASGADGATPWDDNTGVPETPVLAVRAPTSRPPRDSTRAFSGPSASCDLVVKIPDSRRPASVALGRMNSSCLLRVRDGAVDNDLS